MRTSIAAIALIQREVAGSPQWLAQWNEGWQGFNFVGGHKHDDETFRECVIREIHEELGLREGVDFLVASAPLKHLEYQEVSRRAGEETEYTIELFEVALTGSRATEIIEQNSDNCWLSEPEIMAEHCRDGRPLSPTPKRFLRELGWDLFISYAHADNHDDWVKGLVQAIRAEHAKFTPTPLRVFFDTDAIQAMDDWQRRIYDGLHASKLMLAVLSENYFHSDYCRKEWQLYRDHEIRRQMLGESIAPIYIVTVPGFEGAAENLHDDWKADLLQRSDLTRRQYLDVRQWRPHGIQALQENEVKRRLKSLNQQLSERLARARLRTESKSTVPRASDRFVGRTSELARLRELLPQGKVAAITAVQGIGGIGKTALAFAYAQAFPEHYPGGRYLVESAGLNDLRIVLLRLAPDLGITLTDAEQKDLNLAATRVRSMLEQRARTLLILDNVDDSNLIGDRQRGHWLPAGDRLHVLVTTRMDRQDLESSGIEPLPLEPLPENDALELLHRHRPIEGDEEWKAALRIVRGLGGHALALEVVAVYLWRHQEIGYQDYLQRLEAEGIFAALTGTGRDRAVQLSEHPEKLIGPLLEPTLASLTSVELRAVEYAACLPADVVAVPWVQELVSADFPGELEQRPGYPDPWREVELRLVGLRLWMPTEEPLIVRMHRIVQAVAADRMEQHEIDRCRQQVEQHALHRAETVGTSSRLSEVLWEVDPLRDYALAKMHQDHSSAVHIAQWLCDVLMELGRTLDAGLLMRAAVACNERLAAADPANAGWLRDLSLSHDRIGNVLSAQGDLSGAQQSYRSSLEIAERLAAADPTNTGWQRNLSISHDRIGNVLSAQGDLSGALQSYRASLEIRKPLAFAAPPNAVWLRDLSNSLDKIGDVLSAQGDLTVAQQSYRASLEIAERLAAADPANAVWQRDLSNSLDKIGDVLGAQGDLTVALQSYRASLEIREPLAAADPTNTVWQRDLSVSHINIGDVLSAQGDLTVAQQSYRASLEIAERLAAADPTNTGWQRDLSVSLDRIGDVLSAQGDLTVALQSYRASLEIREPLAAADPTNTGWQRDLSLSHDRIGNVLSAHGDLSGAQQSYRSSLEIAERLAAADPTNTVWQRNLSISLDRIGDVLSEQGDLTVALQSYRASLEICEPLAAADPTNTGWQRDLSVSYWKIADVTKKLGDDARTWWQQAHDVLDSMQRRGLFLSAQDEQTLQQLKRKLGM